MIRRLLKVKSLKSRFLVKVVQDVGTSIYTLDYETDNISSLSPDIWFAGSHCLKEYEPENRHRPCITWWFSK